MEIKTYEGYFTFTLDDRDFNQYSYQRILQFLAAVKRSIPVDGRNFYDAEKTWQILDEYRNTFHELKDRYLDKSQGELL